MLHIRIYLGTLRGDDLLKPSEDQEEKPLWNLLHMFRETLKEKN